MQRPWNVNFSITQVASSIAFFVGSQEEDLSTKLTTLYIVFCLVKFDIIATLQVQVTAKIAKEDVKKAQPDRGRGEETQEKENAFWDPPKQPDVLLECI
jgi:hypothetical protein